MIRWEQASSNVRTLGLILWLSFDKKELLQRTYSVPSFKISEPGEFLYISSLALNDYYKFSGPSIVFKVGQRWQ